MGKQRVFGFAGVGLSVVLGLAVGAAVAEGPDATKKRKRRGCAPAHLYRRRRLSHVPQFEETGRAGHHLESDQTRNGVRDAQVAEALKMAADRGLKKAPVESPECLRCHATGWDLSEEQRTQFLKPAFKIEDGVQCETCHGPGEDYKTLKIMKDRSLALKAGLMIGDEKLCLTCHNEQSPAWKPCARQRRAAHAQPR